MIDVRTVTVTLDDTSTLTIRTDTLLRWLPEALGSDPAALHRLAAGESRMLGELVTEARPEFTSSVERAIAESQRTGEKIGEALVRRGVLTPPERDAFLEFQRHQRGQAPTEPRFRLGNILVSQGHITESDLAGALKRQRESGRPLGEQLVAEGRITSDTLHRALDAQRALVRAALIAALAMAGLGSAPPAQAAQTVSRSIDFVIKVPPIVKVRVVREPTALVVTPEDVARGFVEVRDASQLDVTTNTTWEVSFLARGAFFRSARVTGLPGEVVMGPSGGSRANLVATMRASTFQLSYRFDLDPGMAPGTYPWPIAVSAHAV